tara:strand:- start:3803 stop:4141 length:339 start_codon:yes stop_codon:yes gene_type:complete
MSEKKYIYMKDETRTPDRWLVRNRQTGMIHDSFDKEDDAWAFAKWKNGEVNFHAEIHKARQCADGCLHRYFNENGYAGERAIALYELAMRIFDYETVSQDIPMRTAFNGEEL